MKQVIQSLKSGDTQVVETPAPGVRAGRLLVRTRTTLISAGTERMLIDFGRASLINKARQQPDKVKQVLQKLKTDGVGPTLDAVLAKLDQPVPLGYCNVGVVHAVGEGVKGFAVGDRVVSNGHHAEFVSVPKNLCAKIPLGVSDNQASFTVLGAIALQGVRLANPTMGETIVVVGLGLLGLSTLQLLIANGCNAIGVDFDGERLATAKRYGADVVNLSKFSDPVNIVRELTNNVGADAVIITAATKSSDPVRYAAEMCRQRGRIILVGVTGLELSRDEFFKKELTFQVSASYGPGRYDPSYEEKGNDYPIGFVRWTEQRNFQAVLDLMARGRLDFSAMVSHEFSVEDAAAAYDVITSNQPSSGILLTYKSNGDLAPARSTVVNHRSSNSEPSLYLRSSVLNVVGAGNYATGVLLPAFAKAGAKFRAIASSGGLSSLHAAKKYHFELASTDSQQLIEDPVARGIIIATPHNSHARLVCQALLAGKSVFVEKPLCLTLDEIEELKSAYAKSQALPGKAPTLMVGFNRRFSPLVAKAKALLDDVSVPKSYVMTVNSGHIPEDHWIHDRGIGGGRLIGEACHFVDLLRFLCGYDIIKFDCTKALSSQDDTFSLSLTFGDGSIGTIHYFSNGSRSFPKERLEIFAGGRILQLDNFRSLKGYGWPNFSRMNLWRQNKGQVECARAFLNAVDDCEAHQVPIPVDELFEVAKVVIQSTTR